jgi:hypothetical protein
VGAADSSETKVTTYHNLNLHCCGNLKSDQFPPDLFAIVYCQDIAEQVDKTTE